MQNPIAASYVDGCGVHYYTDQFVNPDVLSITHYDFPDKFILATEGCEGIISISIMYNTNFLLIYKKN